MKKTISLLMLMACTSFAQAQTNTNIKYQGEVLAGYSAGIGTFGLDRVNLHTIQGVRFNEYFSTGLGLGLNFYPNYIYDAPELSMPIFLNAKGYLPVSNSTKLFLSLDLGVSVGLTEGMSGMSGFLIAPAVGASFKVSPKNAINISLGYDCQKWSESITSITNGALAVKLGFQF